MLERWESMVPVKIVMVVQESEYIEALVRDEGSPGSEGSFWYFH
ncbi:hypothetical protein J2T13_004390 [Paenibacillus sp. DS2015]